jgi:hypothetical protein
MPAMAETGSQKAQWKLGSPPNTEVRVDDEVLTLRAPLVQVRRDGRGEWSFDGPGRAPGSAKRTLLGAVVDAWPHVGALSTLDVGSAAIWSWREHGWSHVSECRCGSCEQPVAADLDRRTWPSDLHPNHIVSVEQAALSGQIGLTEILFRSGGIAFLGPGDQRRTSDTMTPVAVANVIRRWPHTMQALRSLREGRGLRWDADTLQWREYFLA